jgi:DNA-binding transcriptional MocR family regulator
MKECGGTVLAARTCPGLQDRLRRHSQRHHRRAIADRLPSEEKLAEQFGVNRSTVREGIRLSEQTGVLRRDLGKRLVVSRPSYDSVGDASVAPRLSPQNPRGGLKLAMAAPKYIIRAMTERLGSLSRLASAVRYNRSHFLQEFVEGAIWPRYLQTLW